VRRARHVRRAQEEDTVAAALEIQPRERQLGPRGLGGRAAPPTSTISTPSGARKLCAFAMIRRTTSGHRDRRRKPIRGSWRCSSELCQLGLP
jgi:hypothetical protein